MSTTAESVVSDAEIVAELRAAWAAVSAGYARCWAAMAEVARRTTQRVGKRRGRCGVDVHLPPRRLRTGLRPELNNRLCQTLG